MVQWSSSISRIFQNIVKLLGMGMGKDMEIHFQMMTVWSHGPHTPQSLTMKEWFSKKEIYTDADTALQYSSGSKPRGIIKTPNYCTVLFPKLQTKDQCTNHIIEPMIDKRRGWSINCIACSWYPVKLKKPSLSTSTILSMHPQKAENPRKATENIKYL